MLKRFAVLAAAVLTASAARAAVVAGTQEFDFNAGLADSMTSFNYSHLQDRVGAAGLALGADYLYFASKWFGVGGDFIYDSYGSESQGTYNNVSLGSSQPIAMAAMAVARIQTMPESSLRPYALVGLGWGYLHEHYTSDAHSNGFAWTLGTGLDYDVSDHIVAGVGFRWTYMTLDHQFGREGFSAWDNVNVLGRIGYKFGAEK